MSGTLGAPRREQHLDLVDLGLDQLLPQRVRQLAPALGDHLARLGVGRVEGQDVVRPVARRGRLLLLAHVDRGVAGEHRHRLDALVPHLVQALLRELVAHRAQRLAPGIFRVRHVHREQRAQDLALLLPALELAGDVQLLRREEELQDVRVVPVAERAKQRRGRELLLLVDVDVDHVVDVDRELDPRAPEGDDSRREEPLPVGVGVLLEHHARRPVELAHDHALGAVDHERSEGRHDRQLTEVDFLLDRVLEPLLALDLLVHVEAQLGLEGRRVGHVALDALLDRVLGLTQGVAQELQLVLLVHVRDREQVPEDALQRDVLAGAVDVVGHQQRLERRGLDVEEVRHRHAALALAERDNRSIRLRHQWLTPTQHKWPQRGSPAGRRGDLRGSADSRTSESYERAFRLTEIG